MSILLRFTTQLDWRRDAVLSCFRLFVQASSAGSVLSFTTGDALASEVICNETELFKITVSFGNVVSLISMPCFMSHASIPAEVRAARGLPNDLVRISGEVIFRAGFVHWGGTSVSVSYRCGSQQYLNANVVCSSGTLCGDDVAVVLSLMAAR